MSKREETLEEQDFEQPFDECPIDTPSGWEYRGLDNTGGGVFCRIWRHTTEDMELFYNMLDDRVSIIRAKWHPQEGKYQGELDDVVEKRQAGDEYTESDLQEIAVEMMEDIKS